MGTVPGIAKAGRAIAFVVGQNGTIIGQAGL
jgi:hypothetical protein